MKRATTPALVLALLIVGGCGRDYRPPSIATTGVPASPLGQVVDVEASLPGLQVPGATWSGIDVELRLDIEQSGFGELAARVEYGQARIDRRFTAVEDLSDGRTTITFGPDVWRTGILGPLRVEGVVFELLLTGASGDGGWTVAGSAYETQTATEGSFEGWRRQRFLVSSTDFFSSVGRVAEVAWVKQREIRVREPLTFVSSDAVLRVTGRSVLAINRFTFDNLQRLDPLNGFETTWQSGVGSGSNPHDALLLPGDRGYVTRYEPPFDDVAIFDARRGVVLDTIPLGELAENRDGTPRADGIVEVDGTVFVALQDIDRSFTDFREAKLAVIDPAQDTLVGVVHLGGKNPGALDVLRTDDGRFKLYVALAGIFPGLQEQELSGGVVVVDVTNRAVERLALDDDDAGGNIGGLALASEALGYVIVSDAASNNRVLAFDPEAGEILRTVWQTDSFIPEIAMDSHGLLAVPDRSFFAPRLCLYAVPFADDGTEALVGCAPLSLPPSSVEALD